ncbi:MULTISPECIES: glycosyl hydrolase family 8 [unclassified Alteromonas]|uniref:glycosyl hydrolase family 8 n=1 Tax=unclassified Alteromonas TaxID=2614992 RepID=UPI0006915DC3|nr:MULTISPECIES: glycosyl hydrolase family 8 [unclassified Alteromonas]
MVMRVKAAAVFCLALLLVSCTDSDNKQFEQRFSAYKALFVIDGRIVDTGNDEVSHSEGQGYGMLFAAHANDRAAFDSMWQWTQTVLQRSDGLFSWRYTPCTTKDTACVDDPNNASDGDILIAWALLRAAKRWNTSSYEDEARRIIQAIEEKLIVTRDGYTLLLPGESGFYDGDGVSLSSNEGGVQFNLSYWVFPALSAFSDYSENPSIWQELFASGISVVQKARFSSHQLPSDWTRLYKGSFSIDNVIASEFGFNAVRIPLHLAWSDTFLAGAERNDVLSPFAKWWSQDYVPATLSLDDEKPAEYAMTLGMHAVEQAVNNIVNDTTPKWPDINRDVDYYSASLVLLSMLAVSDISG